MPKLIVTNRDGETNEIEVEDGLTVMEAIRDNGYDELLALCGGCCSCATCHVYVEEGADAMNEAEEDEEDRVEEAPGLQINSRLACQCILKKNQSVQVRVPAWNRNAIKEVPH